MRPTPRTISPIVPEGGNAVHPAAISPEVLLRQCVESRTRRSGPGGQHRNKVETAVVLRHEPTGVTAEASERRSQAENRIVALARLRLSGRPGGKGGRCSGSTSSWASRLASSPTGARSSASYRSGYSYCAREGGGVWCGW